MYSLSTLFGSYGVYNLIIRNEFFWATIVFILYVDLLVSFWKEKDHCHTSCHY
jgi:hypothetical protein